MSRDEAWTVPPSWIVYRKGTIFEPQGEITAYLIPKDEAEALEDIAEGTRSSDYEMVVDAVGRLYLARRAS